MSKKFEGKKTNNLAFWGPYEGEYGQYFMSKPIDAATFDELQKLEIGGRVFLNAKKSENDKAPKFTVSIKPRQADFTKKSGSKAAAVSDDL